MICLAIETSCDDTSVAIVDDNRHVLGMFTKSQVEKHALYGGVVPELASREHEDFILFCAKEAVSSAKIELNQIDIVSVTVCPGLSGPLLVGGSFAKGVSLGLDIPIVGVDHIEAHAISSMIENNDLSPPFLSLVVSGGHTSVIDVQSFTEFRTYAKTRDDAMGEILDKIARQMGIPYPGGAVLDEMSFLGDSRSFSIPNPRFENLDFSFSGIKTWAINILKKLPNEKRNDFASSLVFGASEYVVRNLIEVSRHLGRKKISLGGGVACSKVLRSVLKKECAKNNLELFYPSNKYCADNAAMIGLLGIQNFKNNRMCNIEIF